MHRKLTLLAVLLVLYLFVPAQLDKPRRDSLLNRLQKVKADTSRVLLYIKIGQELELYQPDSAIYYYKLAGAMSNKINYPLGIVKYIGNYTAVMNDRGKFDESLALNLQAVDISRRNNLFRPLAVSLRNVADVYSLMGNYVVASGYYLRALPYFEEIKDSANLSVLFSNLSKCYTSLKMYSKAEDCGNKSIAYANNKWLFAVGYLSKAEAFVPVKKVDDAMILFNKSYNLAKSIDDNVLMAKCLINIAATYQQQHKNDTAIQILNTALGHAKEINDRSDMPILLKQLGESYYYKKSLAQAKQYFTDAARIASEIKSIEQLKAIYKDLAFVETSMGNLQQGNLYDSLYQEINDSLFSAQVAKSFQELNIKYQSEKKENEINNLNKEKAIQNLSIRQTSMLNRLLAGGLLCLLVIAVLLYRNIKSAVKVSKQTTLLQAQHIKELEAEKQLAATEAILQGQEQERERLAKDLHDGLGGKLSGIKLSLSSIKGKIILPEASEPVFEKTFEQLNNTISELRRVAHNMMPEAMVKLGLQQAVQDYCAGLSESNSLQIRCVLYGLETRLNSSTEIIVYRIVQELVNNITRHANATEALVQIMRNGSTLNITVEDNGKGLAATEILKKKGAGLNNVQSRVNYLKGSMDFKSGDNGTSVHIDCNID